MSESHEHLNTLRNQDNYYFAAKFKYTSSDRRHAKQTTLLRGKARQRLVDKFNARTVSTP